MSDLHFNVVNFKYFRYSVQADNLMICGDVCSPFNPIYEKYITECSLRYKRIFIVSGNHEYWGSTIHDTDNKIYEITRKCKNQNVFYLNNKYYMLWNGKKYIRIFGGTLWSFISDHEKQSINRISNDNKYINKFNLEIRNNLYLDTVKNIESHDNFDIIMTHHMPSYTLIDKKYNISKYINCLYSSKCDNLLWKTKYWVCGHTHTYTSTLIGNTKIIINPCNRKDEIIDID